MRVPPLREYVFFFYTFIIFQFSLLHLALAAKHTNQFWLTFAILNLSTGSGLTGAEDKLFHHSGYRTGHYGLL